MQYRTLGRTGIQVGEIGMGCEGFTGKTTEQVREMVDLMESAGVNCIDLYTPNPQVRSDLMYLVHPLFFLPLFQFLWLQGQEPVLDRRKGQQNFWRKPP